MRIGSCESKAYRAAEETGELSYSEFATDPCRSLFKRAVSMFQPSLSDNANVNLVQLGERFVTMTETPLPVQFDPETLATAGVAWEVPGTLTTAHPHLDRASGGMLNYAAKLGPRNEYRFFLLAPDSPADGARVLSSTPTKQPAYMHSFGLTENWIVLAEFPFVVNPLALAFSGRPYIENYRWKPELGTRFTLIDRASGAASGPFVTDACFGFHHVNAYETEDGQVIADICTFDDASIVESLYLGNLRERGEDPGAGADPIHDLADRRNGRLRAPRRGGPRPAANRLRAVQRAPLPLRLGRRHRRQQLLRPGRRRRPRATGEPGLVGAGLLPGRAGLRRRTERGRGGRRHPALAGARR